MRKLINDAKVRKVLDGDFQTKMESSFFFCPPREELTINDMIRYHSKTKFEGREAQVYG